MIYLLGEFGREFLEELRKSKVEFKVINRIEDIKDYCVLVTDRNVEVQNEKVLSILKPSLIKILKWDIRFKVWRRMLNEKVVKFPYDVFGRIPNFFGSEEAAKNLVRIKEFYEARTVFVNPDSPQRPVRRIVLELGKTLVMATPRLKKGFLIIRECKNPREASSIKGAFKYGELTSEIPDVDFIVEGSVAVDKKGHRLGKGSGYGDLEIKLIKRRNPEVKVATTVHDIQVLESIPSEPHDERVDYIVTPTRILSVPEG